MNAIKVGDRFRNVTKGETVTVKRVEVSRVEVLGSDGCRVWVDAADFFATHRPVVQVGAVVAKAA